MVGHASFLGKDGLCVAVSSEEPARKAANLQGGCSPTSVCAVRCTFWSRESFGAFLGTFA